VFRFMKNPVDTWWAQRVLARLPESAILPSGRDPRILGAAAPETV